MKFLDLFAGIGGFSLGLERAGMECGGQVEIDTFCNKVLAKHWPNVKRIKDIKNVKGDEFGTIELVCGGFPCQPFSNSGKRKGKEDDRYLWPEMFRIISKIKPTWIIGENVSGLINMELKSEINDLESIGYDVQPMVIPACSVGLPHRRDRIFILGNSMQDGLQTTFSNDGKSCKILFTQWPNTLSELLGNIRFDISRSDANLRIDNGVSDWVDRISCIGNAVVPQIVEIIGRAIMRVDRDLTQIF